MLEHIEAVFFDLDNTLVNRDGAFYLCVQDFYKQFPTVEIDMDLIMLKDHHGYTALGDLCDWLVEKYPIEGVSREFVFEYIIKNIGGYIVPDLEMLSLLKSISKDYKMGILTNGSVANQMRKINSAELNTIFDDTQIIISQEHQLAKPNPKIFELMLEKINLAPEKVLYVGDNPRNDIFGASQLGIKTCWVSHFLNWEETYSFDWQVGEVNDLLMVLMTDYPKEALESMIQEQMHFGNYRFDESQKAFYGDVEIFIVLRKLDDQKYESTTVFFDGYENVLEGNEKKIFSGTEPVAKEQAIAYYAKGKHFLIYPIVLTNVNCEIVE